MAMLTVEAILSLAIGIPGLVVTFLTWREARRSNIGKRKGIYDRCYFLVAEQNLQLGGLVSGVLNTT